MTCTLITQHSTSGGIKIASGFKPAWTKELDVRGKINFLKHKVSFELKKYRIAFLSFFYRTLLKSKIKWDWTQKMREIYVKQTLEKKKPAIFEVFFWVISEPLMFSKLDTNKRDSIRSTLGCFII